MALENDKIKDLFSSKLNDFEPEVPASIWGGLDQLLSDQPVQAPTDASSASASSTSSASSASGAGFTAAKVVGIVLGAAVAASVAVVVVVNQNETVELSKEHIAVLDEQQIDSAQSLVDSTPSEIIPLLTDLIEPSRVSVPKSEEVHEIEEVKRVKTENLSIETSLLSARGMTSKNMFISPLLFSDPLSTKVDEGLSLAFAANANVLNGDGYQRGGGSLLFSSDLRSSEFISVLDKENSEYDLDHKQPLSFNLLIGKKLTPRLSIETGLVYTHLSSKITSKSIYAISEVQTFNYLGIPINLNYRFLTLDKANLYISVGVLARKDIEGSYTSSLNLPKTSRQILEGELDGIYFKEPYYLKTNISQSNPQFSLHSTLGISYPLYRNLYIYGTAGGAYYLDAGNKYRTIYSDKKFQLDLNMGLKIEF